MLYKWLYPSLQQIYIHSVVQIIGVQKNTIYQVNSSSCVNIYSSSFFFPYLVKKTPQVK